MQFWRWLAVLVALLSAFGCVPVASMRATQDPQVQWRAEAVRKYKYTGKEDLLEIERAEIAPEAAAPGQSVDALVVYVVLLPNSASEAVLTETRALVGQGDNFVLSQREVRRQQGMQSSSIRFTLPKDLARGEYVLVTTITDGKQSKTTRGRLRVI